MLSVRGLEARYGSVQALRGVDFDVAEGEIVALVGGNGAGKSTTLCCISGLLAPSAGSLTFEGRDLQGIPAHDRVRLGLSHCPEGRRVFARMTVAENLQIGAITRADKAAIASDLDQIEAIFPVLAQRRTQAAGTLSGGEQQMLAIGRALMSRPRLLLLDEPSLGLAPLIVQALFAVIADLRRRGTTVLLVEQNARAALGLCDRAVVLERGTVIVTGRGSDLLHDPALHAAYFGGS